jgi:hypothetical protein
MQRIQAWKDGPEGLYMGGQTAPLAKRPRKPGALRAQILVLIVSVIVAVAVPITLFRFASVF